MLADAGGSMWNIRPWEAALPIFAASAWVSLTAMRSENARENRALARLRRSARRPERIRRNRQIVRYLLGWPPLPEPRPMREFRTTFTVRMPYGTDHVGVIVYGGGGSGGRSEEAVIPHA